MTRLPILLVSLMTCGCMFGRRSDTAVHHTLCRESSGAKKSGTLIHMPRAIVPISLRRPSLVISRDGMTEVIDSDRWAGGLESMIPEAIGRRVADLSGATCLTQAQEDAHVTLFIEVLQMDVTGGDARLRLRCRIEWNGRSAGHELEHESRSPLAGPTAADFVSAQSLNMDKAASILSVAIAEKK